MLYPAEALLSTFGAFKSRGEFLLNLVYWQNNPLVKLSKYSYTANVHLLYEILLPHKMPNDAA